MERRDAVRLVLYGKPGCHLCDIAYELLLGLPGAGEFNIQKIDITADPSLWQAYHDKIPVLVINEQMVLPAPFCVADIQSALVHMNFVHRQQ